MKWTQTTEYEFQLDELPDEQYSEIVTGICEKIDPTFYEDGRVGFSHEWADDSQFWRTWPLSDLVKTAVGCGPEAAELASMLAEVEAAAEILKAAMTPNV